jgi:hypothetical protein
MGHIEEFGGPHVARGPDVAKAWLRLYYKHLMKIELVSNFLIINKTTTIVKGNEVI